MLFKIHHSYRDVVALCDKELLGKKFEEGKFQLDLKESFYKGVEVSEQQAIEFIEDMHKEDATFNIVGKKSVQVALKCGVIREEGIKRINGIPYALILL